MYRELQHNHNTENKTLKKHKVKQNKNKTSTIIVIQLFDIQFVAQSGNLVNKIFIVLNKQIIINV